MYNITTIYTDNYEFRAILLIVQLMILKLLVTHTTPKNKNQLHLISLIVILLINKLVVIIIYDNLKRTIHITYKNTNKNILYYIN